MLFEKTKYDTWVYENEIKNYIPDEIIDIHCHVWKKEHIEDDGNAVKRSVVWPSLVAEDNPIEDLKETYNIMFPGKKVSALMFANPSQSLPSLKRMNDYVSGVSKTSGFPALYFSNPKETQEELKNNIINGGFLGVKAYLDLADPKIPVNEIRIFDFFTMPHLEVLDSLGAIAMVHIPRPKRFKDEVNLKDIKYIAQNFKNLKLIIAHIGRAYVPSDMGDALEYLKDCDNIMYDFCANTCSYNMKEILSAYGPKRLMFGSDLPILRMRMKRIEENGTYINLVPPRIYGDPSQDSHLREVSEAQAEKLTYFMYEEIVAMKKATERLGYSSAEIEDLFCKNAKNFLDEAKNNLGKVRK